MDNGVKLSDKKILCFSGELIQISLETRNLIKKYYALFENVNTGWSDSKQEFLTSYVFNVLKEMDSLADMCQNYGNTLIEYDKVKF